jgi:nickel-dependent lactate racemase
MKADLRCGRAVVNLEVPDSTVVLEMEPLAPLADPATAVRDALAHPIQSPPLAQIARGRASACVVISDITRPVPNQIILPPLLETLEAAGIGREAITILIATGMHRPNVGDELAQMVGHDIMARYRIEDRSSRSVCAFGVDRSNTKGLYRSRVVVRGRQGGRCLKSGGGPGRVRTVDLFHAMADLTM